MSDILKDDKKLLQHIQRISGERILKEIEYPNRLSDLYAASAVLFLLGLSPSENGAAPEPSLILNKRSEKVRQPGDLCCPGGGVVPGIDRFLAKAMTLPGLPMWRWPYWSELKTSKPHTADSLRFLFFTSIRESFEEMRLNPFAVRFLGPLPSQQLVMFRRTIYPMIGWVNGQKRFYPNWEVEKIVYLPLRKLLNPANYVRYQLFMRTPDGDRGQCVFDSPSYVHKNHREKEILWGATCRITLKFLKQVFGFTLPDFTSLPIVEAFMDETYVNAA
jgi:hypothetical protein